MQPARHWLSDYDLARYWDLSFRDETKREVDFIESAAARFATGSVRRVLELGSGGGRLVVELAARGYEPIGLDINEHALRYLRGRLARRGLHAQVLHADMATFQLDAPADMALCTFDTFRYLCSERAARSCLRSVAAALRPGGLFILGLHLLPPEAELRCVERWSGRHGRTTVTVTLRVMETDLRCRLERVRFCMLVRNGSGQRRARFELPLRTYSARQFKRLLAAVPQLQLCVVYDFWYEIDEPIALSDEAADIVAVLRRV